MNILNVYATRFYNRKAGNIIGSLLLLLLLLENSRSPAVDCTPDPAGGELVDPLETPYPMDFEPTGDDTGVYIGRGMNKHTDRASVCV